MTAINYRSKPSTCAAMQWTGDNAEQVRQWINRKAHQRGFHVPYRQPGSAELWVAKSQKWCPVSVGDYIIAEPDGDGHYPCQQAIFEDRWEPADNGSEVT